MPLEPDDIDALLKFLDKQWMPEEVQRAYDKLAEDRTRRSRVDTRLSELEQRLRAGAAEDRRVPPSPEASEDPPADLEDATGRS